MKRIIIAAFVASSAFLGCAQTPERLCDHMKTLGEEPYKCEMRLTVEKSRDNEAYQRRADCIMAAQASEVAMECMGETNYE